MNIATVRPKEAVFDFLSAVSGCIDRNEFERLLTNCMSLFGGTTHLVYGYGEASSQGFRHRTCRIVGAELDRSARWYEHLVSLSTMNALRGRMQYFCDRGWLEQHVPSPDECNGIDSMLTLVVRDAQGPAVGFFCFVNLRVDHVLARRVIEIAVPALHTAHLRIRRREVKARTEDMVQVTVREREILKWISRGKTDREIAMTLDRSIHTVKNQVRKLLCKFGTSTRAQMALNAEKQGFLSTMTAWANSTTTAGGPHGR